MSVAYRRDLPSPVVVITWPKILPDIQVVQSTMTSILADEERPREFSILSDWRDSPEAPGMDDVRGFLLLLEEWRHQGLRRWATVVRRDATAAYGMGRMVEIRAEEVGGAYRVFREFDDALEWVGSNAHQPVRDQR